MVNFIIAPFPPPLGGVGVAATNLLEILSEGSGPVETLNTSSNSQRENLYAAKGFRSYWHTITLFFQLLRRSLPLDRFKTVFHLFVTSDIAFFRDALFLLALRAQGKRVVIHLHSKTRGEFFLTPRRLPLFGRVLSLARKVFVLSPDHYRFFSQYIPPTKLLVLENFVLSKEFEIGETCQASDLLYVSRLSEMKGTWELLKAVDIIRNVHGRKDFHLTMAGTADTPENEERINTFIMDHDLTDVLTLIGLVRGSKKTAIFRDNGVFVFPSRFENSPVTLKEATQAGMVIIASDIEANRKILDRSGNHLVFPVEDEEALAATILRLLDEPDLFEKLRGKARDCPKYDETYARKVLAPFLS